MSQIKLKKWIYALVCLTGLSIEVHAIDTIFYNGSVYSVGQGKIVASAVVVENGLITYIGNDAHALAMSDEETQPIDLDGRFLMPGFIDTHNHVFEGASEVGGNCELAYDLPLSKQGPYLEDCRSNVSRRDDWVIGYGHQLDYLMEDTGGTEPREFLDQYFSENPIVIMEESSHSMLVNSLALEKIGFDARSDHPVGGRIMFSETSGEPNGILFDNAGDLVMEMAWNSQADRFRASYDGLIAGMDLAVKNGITTIGDGRLYWKRGWHEVWEEALGNGDVIVRTSLRPWIYPEVDFDEQLNFLESIAYRNTHDLLIIDQVKIYIDGVMHFGTAKMLKPYIDSWQSGLPYGLNYISPDALPDLLLSLDQIGYGVHVHAIGDGGVREVLDAFEYARDKGVRKTFSMTHLELVDVNDLPRFKQLQVHADFQAGASYFDKTGWARFYIGRERAKGMMPMRKLYDVGANITFSSDWTVNPLNPLVAIANSMRLRESRGLPDVHAAIRAATINGARALALDSVTGSIEVGKSADLVILDRDITRSTWSEIKAAKVAMTMLRGEIVFQQ
ncbi:MAG: amidohydrolase [Pseudomonadota bacterium]